MVTMDFVKECCKELKQNFKGIESLPYGYCCNTCYYTDIPKTEQNENDYVSAKNYLGGNNNQKINGEWQLGNTVFWQWGLTNFKLDDILKCMKQVADKYGYIVIAPETENKCIKVKESV